MRQMALFWAGVFTINKGLLNLAYALNCSYGFTDTSLPQVHSRQLRSQQVHSRTTLLPTTSHPHNFAPVTSLPTISREVVSWVKLYREWSRRERRRTGAKWREWSCREWSCWEWTCGSELVRSELAGVKYRDTVAMCPHFYFYGKQPKFRVGHREFME